MTAPVAAWNAIGVFGGAFDPVHFGHLRTAFECRQRLQLQEIRFFPCGLPPHREPPVAPGELRRRMLEAATAGVDGFVVDARELERQGPSYTVDTLRSLRQDFPGRTLCLLLGLDAFAGLATWHEWQDVPELAHIIVARRPGATMPTAGAVGALLAERFQQDATTLRARRSGCVHVLDATQLEISSTDLRDSIAAGLSPVYLLPDPVREIIVEARCYGSQALQS